MSDARNTRSALAQALKELILEEPFAKITVADICSRCNMNRKSFYYHFKDKYDLVNWIFDVEFVEALGQGNPEDTSIWSVVRLASSYFYENREFYRRMFKIQGQNSLQEHLEKISVDMLIMSISRYCDSEELVRFTAHQFAHSVIVSFEWWILSKDCMQPDDFVTMMKSSIHILSKELMEGE